MKRRAKEDEQRALEDAEIDGLAPPARKPKATRQVHTSQLSYARVSANKVSINDIFLYYIVYLLMTNQTGDLQNDDNIGTNAGDDDGTNAGDDDGTNTGDDDGTNAGDDDGTNAGDEHFGADSSNDSFGANADNDYGENGGDHFGANTSNNFGVNTSDDNIGANKSNNDISNELGENKNHDSLDSDDCNKVAVDDDAGGLTDSDLGANENDTNGFGVDSYSNQGYSQELSGAPLKRERFLMSDNEDSQIVPSKKQRVVSVIWRAQCP
jgi:hypothetical protein